MLPNLFRELDQEITAEVCMADFAPTELDGHLDPIAVLQELDRATDLGVEIALTNLYFEPYLFEIDRPLMAAGFLLAPGLLILELALVEKPSDRRCRHRGDLDEIVASLLRNPESLRRGQHAHLVALFVHDPHLRDANQLVDAELSTQA